MQSKRGRLPIRGMRFKLQIYRKVTFPVVVVVHQKVAVYEALQFRRVCKLH